MHRDSGGRNYCNGNVDGYSSSKPEEWTCEACKASQKTMPHLRYLQRVYCLSDDEMRRQYNLTDSDMEWLKIR